MEMGSYLQLSNPTALLNHKREKRYNADVGVGLIDGVTERFETD